MVIGAESMDNIPGGGHVLLEPISVQWAYGTPLHRPFRPHRMLQLQQTCTAYPAAGLQFIQLPSEILLVWIYSLVQQAPQLTPLQ